MNIENFSKDYKVRVLSNEDIELIYELCRGNPLYYEYCPPMVTRESIRRDLAALPPNVERENKYYVGFFDADRLIAVMDFIDGYPEKNIAFIGFFMTDAGIQNKGIGTSMITTIVDYLKSMNYKSIRLAWVEGNPQAEGFWRKNGFRPIGETKSAVAESVIVAERGVADEK